MLTFKSIKCKVGLHDWSYTEAEYNWGGTPQNDTICREIGMPSKDATRTCDDCGKHQVQDIHCLGLNPPEYVETWFNKV